MSEPFLGQIQPVAFNFPPRGWAFCDGQLMAISQNTALFSLLGTTYGGDGRVNFALPDFRSRAPMHTGSNGAGTHTLGESGGVEAVSLLSNQISHTHSVSQPASKDEETTNRPDNAYFTVGGAYASASSGAPMGGATTSATGGGQPHTNLQPLLALQFAIALQGIFPSQT